VVVVQADPFNDSRIRTVIVAIVTSDVRWADSPGNILLTRRVSELPKDSVVNVSQLVAVDRSLLTARVSSLSSEAMQRIDEGLRLVLSL
jgi:mRNA interferase MazF